MPINVYIFLRHLFNKGNNMQFDEMNIDKIQSYANYLYSFITLKNLIQIIVFWLTVTGWLSG